MNYRIKEPKQVVLHAQGGSGAGLKQWVGLTDEEIAQGLKESWVTEQAWQSAVWWAEAKLKEKNGGEYRNGATTERTRLKEKNQ